MLIPSASEHCSVPISNQRILSSSWHGRPRNQSAPLIPPPQVPQRNVVNTLDIYNAANPFRHMGDGQINISSRSLLSNQLIIPPVPPRNMQSFEDKSSDESSSCKSFGEDSHSSESSRSYDDSSSYSSHQSSYSEHDRSVRSTNDDYSRNAKSSRGGDSFSRDSYYSDESSSTHSQSSASLSDRSCSTRHKPHERRQKKGDEPPVTPHRTRSNRPPVDLTSPGWLAKKISSRMLNPTNHSCKDPTAKHSQDIATVPSRRDSRWGETSENKTVEKKEDIPDFLKPTKQQSSHTTCQNSKRNQMDPPPVIAPKEEPRRPICDSTPTPSFINEMVGSSMAIERRVPVTTADGQCMTLVFNDLDGSVHVVPSFTPDVLPGQSIPSVVNANASITSEENSSDKTKSRKGKKKKEKTTETKKKKKKKKKSGSNQSESSKTKKTKKKMKSITTKSDDSSEKKKKKKKKEKKSKSERDDPISLLAKKLKAIEAFSEKKVMEKKSKSKELKRSDDDGDKKKKHKKKKMGSEEEMLQQHISPSGSPYKNPSNNSISTISTDETSSCFTFDERKAMSLIRELQVFARQL